MITTKVQIEPYLAEYLRGKYWDMNLECVRFPPGSDIYVTIYDLISKRPVGIGMDKGNIELAIPDRREAIFSGGKSPQQYNYISARAAKILERRIRTMMWAEVHDMMDDNKHNHGIDYTVSACMFLSRYNISSIQEDGILKHYQRWRNKIRPKRAKR